jgi:PAS domain S-box-containing protein
MLEVFTSLFDLTGFSPRKDCGTGWTPTMIGLHVTSDLFIWLAYVSIPLVLFYFTRRRDLPFPRLFILFALFILACGTTHLIDALVFEYPLYRFAAVMKLVTATVSWVTVIALVPAIPRVMQTATEAPRPGAETKLHRPLRVGRMARTRDYIVALLAAVLSVLVRAAIDPVLQGDQVFVLALLAVVYVSWQCGFGPGILCLVVSLGGYVFFFIPPRYSLLISGLGTQLAVALFFFCGVACAALGESQRAAQRRARAALATAVGRREELESEVIRRRVVEAALRQREADLVAAQRETAAALARLSAFLDNAPLGIAFFDPDLKYVRINPFLAAANGKPVEEHIGRTLPEVLPDFPPDIIGAYRRVASAEGEPYTAQLRRGDARRSGATRVWQATAFPVRGTDGGTFGAGVFVQDVTDRLRAEEELRRSERNLADFFENANVGLHWVGPDGVILRANKAELEMLGYTSAEYVGRPVAEFHTDPDASRDILERLRRGERLDNYPARLRCKDGSTRDVLIASSVLWEDGKFVHTRSFARDVTDLNRATEALRESEAFRRSVFENTPDCVKILALDGRILEMNGTGAASFEIDDPASIRGAPWAELWPVANRETVREAVAGARGGAVVRFQGFCPTMKGAPKYWDVSVAALPGAEGAPHRLVAVSRDVTEQRRAEDAVRASEQRFRTLTEAVPQLVWTADPKGQVTFCNRRWAEYTGTPATAERADAWGGGVIHSDDEDEFRSAWAGAVAEPGAPFTHEFRLRRTGDGEYRWMLAAAVPLKDATGAVAEWVGTLTDIDDQKRQTQLLERLVGERTAELERSNDELEKFAYIASHDLQEPLRKIQAFGDRLRNKCRELLPDNGREYVDRMLSAAGRMRRLIDDLLTFSRVTTQKRPFVRLDLGRVAREVVSDLEVRIAQSGGTVAIGNMPAVEADPTQMRQLFQNLIVNAVKFHRPGVPPVVEVAGELVNHAPADPDTDEPVPVCRLSVRDNGIGFDEKYRDRIFDVFQRLHGRDEYEGTGVGLAICRKIAERHGGAITAHGRPGEGATFVVTLPVRQPNPSEASVDGHPEQTDHDRDGR